MRAVVPSSRAALARLPRALLRASWIASLSNAAIESASGLLIVVPDAELRGTAFALAKSLAEGPSIALARMKDNLDHAVTSDFLDSMDQEAKKWSGLHGRAITRRRCVPSSTNESPHSMGIRMILSAE